MRFPALLACSPLLEPTFAQFSSLSLPGLWLRVERRQWPHWKVESLYHQPPQKTHSCHDHCLPTPPLPLRGHVICPQRVISQTQSQTVSTHFCCGLGPWPDSGATELTQAGSGPPRAHILEEIVSNLWEKCPTGP